MAQEDTIKVDLPFKPEEPETINPGLLLIYGPPKCGKTTFLSQLPNNFIEDLEEGTKYLKALKRKISSLAEIKAYGLAIREKDPLPYKYISIDTADILEDWCLKKVNDKYKQRMEEKNEEPEVDSVLDLPFGNGYQRLRDEFQKWIDFINTLAPHRIIVCHSRLTKYTKGKNQKKGTESEAQDIDLTGKNRNMLCSMADAIGYMYIEDGVVKISFNTNDDDVNAGTRCKHLKGKEFVIGVEDENGDFQFDWSQIYIGEKPNPTVMAYIESHPIEEDKPKPKKQKEKVELPEEKEDEDTAEEKPTRTLKNAKNKKVKDVKSKADQEYIDENAKEAERVFKENKEADKLIEENKKKPPKQTVLELVADAKDRDELNYAWTLHPELQKDPEVRTAVKTKRDALNNTPEVSDGKKK